MVNNAEIGIIHLHSVPGGDFVGTGVVVTHVNAGDDVYVRTHASWNDCHIFSDMRKIVLCRLEIVLENKSHLCRHYFVHAL